MDENRVVQNLMQAIVLDTQKFSQNTNQIHSIAQQFGTSRENASMREKVSKLNKDTDELAKNLAKKLKETNSHSNFINKDKQLKAQFEKLTDSFSKCLKIYQDVQKFLIEKQQQAKTTENYDASYSKKLIEFEESPQQEQVQSNVKDQLISVQERNEALRELEQNIVDVHGIFKDLAVIVHEQGEMIDSIEGNVTSAQMQVEDANTQLRAAVTYQSSARRKKIYIVLILLVVLLIIGLVIYFSLK